MTDRCISVQIRSSFRGPSSGTPPSFLALSCPEPLCPSLDSAPSTYASTPVAFISQAGRCFPSILLSFAEGGRCSRPGRGNGGTPRNGDVATTNDGLIKNESVGSPRRPITQLDRYNERRRSMLPRDSLSFSWRQERSHVSMRIALLLNILFLESFLINILQFLFSLYRRSVRSYRNVGTVHLERSVACPRGTLDRGAPGVS